MIVGILGCCQQDLIVNELKVVPIYTSDFPTMLLGSGFLAATAAGRQAGIDDIRKTEKGHAISVRIEASSARTLRRNKGDNGLNSKLNVRITHLTGSGTQYIAYVKQKRAQMTRRLSSTTLQYDG